MDEPTLGRKVVVELSNFPPLLRPYEVCRDVKIIGTSRAGIAGRVIFGTERLVDMLSGAQLPRIC